MSRNLGVPGEGRKNLGRNLNVEIGADVDGVTGECVEAQPGVMPQIPCLCADRYIWKHPVSERGRSAERGLLVAAALLRQRPFRFEEKIEAEVCTVLDDLKIGIDVGLEPIIDDALAGGLVDIVPFRFDRQGGEPRNRPS